ncbi:MAG: response regulator [Alphaproteobacteria bacterium]|nr:response regulator [Alphaproteobacteria bacterium]
MNEVNVYIGSFLRDARKRRKLTQDYVAEKVGISRQLMQQYEQGISKIHVSRLFAMCQVIGEDVHELMENVSVLMEKSRHQERNPPRSMEIVKNRPLRVLLVEDSKADELSIVQAIEVCDEDVDLNIARDGAQALRILGKDALDYSKKPDIILLDLNLPMISGRDLLKQFRAHSVYCSIPIVVLTNSTNIQEMQSAYMLGASGYLVKSFDLEDFYHNIQIVITYWYTNILP